MSRRSRSVEDEADDARAAGRTDVFKRPRLRGGEGESPDYGSQDGSSQADGSQPGSSQANGVASPGGDFSPGAIVRVTVENFVTYEHAEFSPGPSLNMVIGPNGTGKSSLVCAICLGLGYHSNVLGRASAFGEFVKHGQECAVIEIELRGAESNTIVRLRITREDNSRKFWLDGRESTLRAVQQLTQALRIQIDNLCQFLPQDKVAEFAGLNSVDLLAKTLQAAAPPDMMEDRERLRALFSRQRDARAQLAADADQLARLEARQESLQADVDKIRERDKIKAAMAELSMARVLVVYGEARRDYTAAKKAKRDADAALVRLRAACAPALQAVRAKERYRDRVDRAFHARQAALRRAEAAADRLVAEVDAADEAVLDLVHKGEAEGQALAAKRAELAKIRRRITDLEAAHKQEPREFDAAEWNTRIREQEHLLRDHHTGRRQVAESIHRTKAAGSEKQAACKKLGQDLAELESQQGQQLARLKKMNPDAARAWDWVQQNQDRFDKEVFGPPLLSCSVRDERYADLVQSLLQPDDFFCFTAQTRDDHKRLSDQLYREMSLSVTVRTCLTPLASFRAPVASPELASLGLDGFVLDFLDGPEPVLAMLCAEKRVHASGVALAELAEDHYHRLLAGEAVGQFAAGRQSYRVARRREYGPSAVSTRVRPVDRGRFWTDQPVDAADKQRLQQQMGALKDEIAPLKDELAQLQAQDAELEAAQGGAKERLDDLRAQKAELQLEYNKWQALPDKIDMEKKTLADKRQELAASKSRIMAIESDKDAAALHKARLALRHKDSLVAIRAAHLALLDAQLRLLEARSDADALTARNQDIQDRLEAEQRLLADLARNQDGLKARAQRALHDAQAIPDETWDRTRLLELGRGKTAADLDDDVRAEQTRLDVIEAGNPHALAEFERRAADMDRLSRDRARRQQELDALDADTAALRARWEPRLDELVGRINDAFSHNFEQISCAGEVGVHKDEQFDRWAIEIRVKFRPHESLQRLDQHRQSGGERAVSTIFYLMSLQSMAQAPFRVVDEINQGMDPRNERMVHERMVDIACREHTSQYFLITPKLLSGLRYDDRMRVLCIASGEHMPLDGSRLDFAGCARIRRALA